MGGLAIGYPTGQCRLEKRHRNGEVSEAKDRWEGLPESEGPTVTQGENKAAGWLQGPEKGLLVSELQVNPKVEDSVAWLEQPQWNGWTGWGQNGQKQNCCRNVLCFSTRLLMLLQR